MKNLDRNNPIGGLICLILLLILNHGVVQGQLGLYQKESDPINPLTTTSYDFSFKGDFNVPSGDVGVRKGTFYVRTDFIGKYKFGREGGGVAFSYTVSFDLVPMGVANPTSVRHTLKLTNEEPVAYYYKNLNAYLRSSSNGFSIDGFRIENISTSDVNLPIGYENEVKLYVGYEAEYKLDPEGMEFVVKKVELKDEQGSLGTKTAKFTWFQQGGHPYYVPGYELQLLKLQKGGLVSATAEGVYEVDLDWEKALSYYIEKPFDNTQGTQENSIYLTLGQGSGLYTWRIRSIGTKEVNGIGDSRNWGPWDNNSPQDGVIAINELLPLKNYHYFEFVDPDEDKNYSYNRVFSEETKTKEKTTYATGLQNIRQEQVYLPSKDVTVLSQTLQDKSGRNAITTIPVPKEGKTFTYEEGLTQNESGEFYRVEEYDVDTKLKAPSKMNQGSGSLMNYYTDENPDGRIPTTEGYPYARTLYSSDGTGRPVETSGIGKTHSIGNQQVGRGRTTRISYGSASEEELTRLFGDEAPHPNYVKKTVTFDQNNTASVTYTTLEGQVIATGLVFTDQEDNLLPLAKELEEKSVTTTFSTNTETRYAVVSTKRVVLTQASTLDLTYKLKCLSLLDLCADGGISCGYRLRFTVYDNAGYKVFGSADIPIVTNSESCDGVSEITSSASTEELAPGEYLVEKKLFKDDVDATAPGNNLQAELDPIAEWIRTNIDSALCFQQLLDFYNELIPYSELHNGDPVSITVYDANGVELSSSDLPIEQPRLPQKVEIINSCCRIELDVSCFPPLTCPTNDEIGAFKAGHPTEADLDALTVNANYHDDPKATDYLFDYEGYTISLIRKCDASMSEQAAKELFYGNMTGWHEEGTFNKMVYHMLTDEYSYGGFGANGKEGECSRPTDREIPDTLDEVDPLCNPDLNNPLPGVRYKCFDVLQCWENTVQQFINFKCKGERMDSLFGQSGKTLAALVDEQKEGDKSFFNDHFDNGFKGFFLIKWLAKRKLSKELRKESVSVRIKPSQVLPLPQYNSHLVSQFLMCTGYQFADIINTNDVEYPKNSPATGNNSPYADDPCFYSIEGDFTGAASGRKYNPEVYFQSHFNQNNPKLQGPEIGTVSEWEEQEIRLNEDETAKLKEVFPRIKHPVYAFKYFEYGYGSDNALEALNCFRDPNMCIDGNGDPIPCCGTLAGGDPKPCNFSGIGKITCPYTSAEWTTGQRLTFYKKLTIRPPLYDEDADPADMAIWEEKDGRIDCPFLKLEQQWSVNLTGEESKVGLEYIPMGPLEENNWWDDLYPDHAPLHKIFTSIGGASKGKISMIEIEALRMMSNCESGCDGRREEFRKAVVKMFLDRCYVIGDCKSSLEDNVVPEEDVEAITDALIEKCEGSCRITTYTCDDEFPSRKVSTEKEVLGNNDIELKVQMGVGGSGDCPTQEAEMLDCSEMQDLTYQEYILWLMGKNWNLDLEIPSKCNQDGIYDAAYTGPDWYWYNNKNQLELYNPPPCTTPGDDPTVDEAYGNPHLIPRGDGKIEIIKKKSAAIDVHVEVGN